MSTKTLDKTPANARPLFTQKVAGDKPAENQRFDGSELFRPGLPNSEEIANKSGVPTVGSSAKKGTMHRTPDKLPDPWLFDSEALLRELDRCRSLVAQIAIDDPQATHFTINIAVDAIWRLQQTIRYLLHLHREGQRAFAVKTSAWTDQKAKKAQENLVTAVRASQQNTQDHRTFANHANKVYGQKHDQPRRTRTTTKPNL